MSKKRRIIDAPRDPRDLEADRQRCWAQLGSVLLEIARRNGALPPEGVLPPEKEVER